MIAFSHAFWCVIMRVFALLSTEDANLERVVAEAIRHNGGQCHYQIIMHWVQKVPTLVLQTYMHICASFPLPFLFSWRFITVFNKRITPCFVLRLEQTSKCIFRAFVVFQHRRGSPKHRQITTKRVLKRSLRLQL